MTKAEYNKWRRNGNFTISQERLLQVSNHISEGEHSAYTKKEAAQVATYWSLKEHQSQHAAQMLEIELKLANLNLSLALKGKKLI